MNGNQFQGGQDRRTERDTLSGTSPQPSPLLRTQLLPSPNDLSQCFGVVELTTGNHVTTQYEALPTWADSSAVEDTTGGAGGGGGW